MTTNQLIKDTDCLSTPTTRRLRHQIDSLASRSPSIAAAITAVLGGNDSALLRLVRAAQAGDQEAGVVAVTALLPRMSGTVIKTVPVDRRRPAIDEFVSLAYLVMLDVGRREKSEFLAKKVVARTRRRYERHVRALSPARVTPVLMIDGPAGTSDTDREALGRLDLERVATAVECGVVSEQNWHLVTGAGLGTLDGPLDQRQRQAVVRNRRRLAEWCRAAEAA